MDNSLEQDSFHDLNRFNMMPNFRNAFRNDFDGMGMNIFSQLNDFNFGGNNGRLRGTFL